MTCTSAGVRCALVTMSEGPLAREIVASLPKPYFEFLVTGDTVTQGKPHPEAYLKAVELLQEADPGLTIDHCVALEDSAPGSSSGGGIRGRHRGHSPYCPAAGRSPGTPRGIHLRAARFPSWKQSRPEAWPTAAGLSAPRPGSTS